MKLSVVYQIAGEELIYRHVNGISYCSQNKQGNWIKSIKNGQLETLKIVTPKEAREKFPNAFKTKLPL